MNATVSRDEFFTRHSQGEKPVKDGSNRLLFPTGAIAEEDGHGEAFALRLEPPDSPIERLKLQRRYAVVRSNQLRMEFTKAHQHWLGITEAAISDPLSWQVDEEDYAKVEALKEEHDKFCDRIADLDKQIRETPEESAALKEEEERAKLAQLRSIQFMDLHQKFSELELKTPPVTQ